MAEITIRTDNKRLLSAPANGSICLVQIFWFKDKHKEIFTHA